MDTLIPFLIGIFAQVVVVSCAARLDRYIQIGGKWKGITLPNHFKKCFILTKKQSRSEFLLLSVIMHTAAYAFLFLSVILYVISLIFTNEITELITIYFSFIIAGLALVGNIYEIIVLSTYKTPTE
jgi:hypothetical protein